MTTEPFFYNCFFRDLKSNNILLKSTIHGVCPHAVMCDFGLAYVGTAENMRLSFPHNSMSRGGNPVLWAPEVKFSYP